MQLTQCASGTLATLILQFRRLVDIATGDIILLLARHIYSHVWQIPQRCVGIWVVNADVVEIVLLRVSLRNGIEISSLTIRRSGLVELGGSKLRTIYSLQPRRLAIELAIEFRFGIQLCATAIVRTQPIVGTYKIIVFRVVVGPIANAIACILG